VAGGSCESRVSLRNSAAKACAFGSCLLKALAASVTQRAMRPLLSAFIASTSLLDVAMVRRVIMASMAALVSSRPAVSERCRCAIKGFAEFKLRRFQHEIHGGTESCHPQRLEHEEQCDVEARNLSVPRAGHQVVFGVRSPSPDRSEERTIPESIREADAAILAVPFGAVADVIKGAGSLAGKVLIDATNPLGMVEGGLGLTMGFSSSGAERIAALAPGAFVFKAFNQTGFEKMADSRPYASRPVMFVAGDEPDGKQIVLTLVGNAGYDAVDLGALRQARLIEPFAMIWIELGRKRGHGPDFSFTVQHKGSTQWVLQAQSPRQESPQAGCDRYFEPGGVDDQRLAGRVLVARIDPP